MNRKNARAKRESERITPHAIKKLALSLFRRNHDYGCFDLQELVHELEQLGISTVKELRLLLKKHRRSILDDERRKMSRAETLDLLSHFGVQGVDTHSNTAWFAVPGLVREALEKEFGWEAVKPFHESSPACDDNQCAAD